MDPSLKTSTLLILGTIWLPQLSLAPVYYSCIYPMFSWEAMHISVQSISTPPTYCLGAPVLGGDCHLANSRIRDLLKDQGLPSSNLTQEALLYNRQAIKKKISPT